MRKNLKPHMESPSFSLCKPDETVEWATIYHWAEVISDEPGMRTLSQCQPISKTEKNIWQFASLLVQATFRGSIFPNCWFSVIPMLLLVFYSFSFSTWPLFMPFLSSSIFDCLPYGFPYQREGISSAVVCPCTSVLHKGCGSSHHLCLIYKC